MSQSGSFKKLEKEKGKTAYCQTCNTLMFCNEVPASGNYPAKLQWQNKNGTAHYLYDYKTGKVSCNAEPDTASKLPELGTVTEPEIVFQKKVAEALRKYHLIEDVVKKDLGTDANPQHVGLVIKLIFDQISQ